MTALRETTTKQQAGKIQIVESVVRYRKGSPSWTVFPVRDWEFPLSTIKLVGEYTTDEGPFYCDYFYVLVAGNPLRMYRLPLDGNKPVGFFAFMSGLKSSLPGRFEQRLIGSTDFADHVMWPPQLVGETLLDSFFVPRQGMLGRLWDRV
jgi:hypothetical protein